MKPEKFLLPNEVKTKAKEWQALYAAEEKNGVSYTDFHRTTEKIDNIHEISFIKKIIPGLIARKRPGEKVRILDIGTGTGTFPEEIRKTFGDRVDVFSTGLSKRTVKDYLKQQIPETKKRFHPNDFKWRSILELSDFEEFDLIVDTYGELFISVLKQRYEYTAEAFERLSSYLGAIVKKLKPGGLASIVPGMGLEYLFFPENADILQSLEKEAGVKIKHTHDFLAIRIEKNK